MADPEAAGPPGTAAAIVPTAFKGLCPRCGARTLFAGPVEIAERCRACGLDFSQYEGSDRFAAILNLLLAGALIWLALTIDRTLRPSLLLQALVWIPVMGGSTFLLLRLMRARTVVTRYRRAEASA